MAARLEGKIQRRAFGSASRLFQRNDFSVIGAGEAMIAGADNFFAALLQRALDTVGDRLDGVDADRPFFAGAFQTVDDLHAVVGFAPAVFLDDQRHHLLDSFVGRKTPATVLAFAPAPDHVAILAQARIDHAILDFVAKRALHFIIRGYYKPRLRLS